MRNPARNLVKAAILIAWLGIMGWLWHDSRLWPVPEKIQAAFLPDYYDHFALNYAGQKVGWATKSLRRLPGGAYQAAQTLTIRLRAAAQEINVTFQTQADFDPSLNLLKFQYVLSAGPLVVTEVGQVTAGRLRAEVRLGEYGPPLEALRAKYAEALGSYAELLDFSKPTDVPAPVGPGLLPFVPTYLGYLGPTLGRRYGLTVFDPASRRLTPAEVRVEASETTFDPDAGLEINVFRTRLGANQTDPLAWLDRYGRVWREEFLGFTLTRALDQADASKDIHPFEPPAAWLNLATSPALKEELEKAVKGYLK